MSSRFPTNSTPFPNWLIDDVMPNLTDTQWRVLVIIVRSTLGWKSKAGRKESDWLTQSQFKRRSGRASGAISSAIDCLVKLNLIEVRNDVDNVLISSSDRRRTQGRLYFSIKSNALKTINPTERTNADSKLFEKQIAQFGK